MIETGGELERERERERKRESRKSVLSARLDDHDDDDDIKLSLKKNFAKAMIYDCCRFQHLGAKKCDKRLSFLLDLRSES